MALEVSLAALQALDSPGKETKYLYNSMCSLLHLTHIAVLQAISPASGYKAVVTHAALQVMTSASGYIIVALMLWYKSSHLHLDNLT